MTLCSYAKTEQGRTQTQRGRRCSEFLFYTLKNLVINAKTVGLGDRQWREHGGENGDGRSLFTKGNLVRLLVEWRQTPVDESHPASPPWCVAQEEERCLPGDGSAWMLS